MDEPTERDVAADIVELLERGPRRARFVTELASRLRRADVTPELLRRRLDELEAAGRVVVREPPCPDPHLAGADLRIVALVGARAADGPGAAGDDPLAAAVGAIEAVWSGWLADYLANHRCG
jgi:DNA-binding Lrp family transcriptional regulator